jgi:hypothetical protein
MIEMNNHCVRCAVLMLFPALFLFACSSSGGGTGGTGIISRGTISEFGSIVVNGTEFDTNDTEVIVSGEEVGVGDTAVFVNLDVGRVVTVIATSSGDGEHAVADQVIYRNDVRGPVADIHETGLETMEITVLGQTIIANTVTRFEGTDFDTLAIGDVVEVSGYYDDMGIIWATYLEKVTAELIVEVVGYVTNLDDVQRTFRVNALLVDYALAETGLLPGGAPAEGLLVEIEGTYDQSNEIMEAAAIRPADELDVDDVGQIEIMGFVTEFTSIYNFVVGNQPVQVNTDAEIVDGTIADISLGVKLEAEGTLADGILYAHEIEFWEPNQIEVEGLVTQVVTISDFYINGQEVITEAKTVYDGGRPGDIAVGVNIEIKGRLVEGILYADKVSFELD